MTFLAPPDQKSPDVPREVLVHSLQHANEVLGLAALLNSQPAPPFPATTRDALRSIAAKAVIPTSTELNVSVPESRWWQWLGWAELLEDPLRPSRGILRTAADGHACSSVLERIIDDYLSEHGIEHGREPHYPTHPLLNANVRSRAGWLLPGNTYVEAAGMMSSPRYRAKMKRKLSIASDQSLRLIFIEPSDLDRLPHLLGGFRTS